MTEAINFWLAKAYVDLLIGFGIFGLIIIIWLVLVLIISLSKK